MIVGIIWSRGWHPNHLSAVMWCRHVVPSPQRAPSCSSYIMVSQLEAWACYLAEKAMRMAMLRHVNGWFVFYGVIPLLCLPVFLLLLIWWLMNWRIYWSFTGLICHRSTNLKYNFQFKTADQIILCNRAAMFRPQCVKPSKAGNTWECTQHCGYWCLGTKAPCFICKYTNYMANIMLTTEVFYQSNNSPVFQVLILLFKILWPYKISTSL